MEVIKHWQYSKAWENILNLISSNRNDILPPLKNKIFACSRHHDSALQELQSQPVSESDSLQSNYYAWHFFVDNVSCNLRIILNRVRTKCGVGLLSTISMVKWLRLSLYEIGCDDNDELFWNKLLQYSNWNRAIPWPTYHAFDTYLLTGSDIVQT